MIKVGIGTKFHSVYCDGNCQWTVKEKKGKDVWLCKIEEDMDYAGTIRHFSTKEIQASLNQQFIFDELMNDHDAFYKSLTPGQIVHYNNGFQNFVRCEVVVKDGQNVLKPIALVGAWREWDLPKRMADGSISYCYHADKISKGETFTPNAGCIYESNPDSSVHHGVNPTKMPAIDLSVPEMTDEQKQLAALWEMVHDVEDIIRDNETRSNPGEIIKRIKKYLS